MIKRYSDEVPYEQRRYWYFTLHGIGPGTIPKDLKVLEVKEGRNEKGTLGDFICLDGILNTSELKKFDLKEMTLPEEDNIDICKFIQNYLKEYGFKQYDDIWEDNEEIHIILDGDWKHEHQKLKNLMQELSYYEIASIPLSIQDADTYKAEHIFIKIK